MHKYYTFKIWGEEYKIWLEKNTYKWGGRNNLAIQAFLEGGEPFAMITTNLPEEQLTNPDTCAYIDVNNLKGIEDFLIENAIAVPTNNIGFSGYCIYPEYKFNLENLG